MLIYKEQLPEDTMDVRLLELPFSTVEAARKAVLKIDMQYGTPCMWYQADAEEHGTTFEEIDGIDFTEKEIDDDALFDEEYENACEFEWECQTGR